MHIYTCIKSTARYACLFVIKHVYELLQKQIYTYIYTYIYIYICIYIHIYIYMCMNSTARGQPAMRVPIRD